MAWYNLLSWGKKRTGADIKRAKALEIAHYNLSSITKLLEPPQPLNINNFLPDLIKTKNILESIGDRKYTPTLNDIINKLANLRKVFKTLDIQDYMDEIKLIENQLIDLRDSILDEYISL